MANSVLERQLGYWLLAWIKTQVLRRAERIASTHKENPMTYNNQPHPWCIVRKLPNNQSRLIVRLRRSSDAEAHLQILSSKNPTASYEIVFDVTSQDCDLMVQQALS